MLALLRPTPLRGHPRCILNRAKCLGARCGRSGPIARRVRERPDNFPWIHLSRRLHGPVPGGRSRAAPETRRPRAGLSRLACRPRPLSESERASKGRATEAAAESGASVDQRCPGYAARRQTRRSPVLAITARICWAQSTQRSRRCVRFQVVDQGREKENNLGRNEAPVAERGGRVGVVRAGKGLGSAREAQ